MKKSRSRIILLLCALMLVMSALAGCGSGNTNNAQNNSAQVPGTQSSETQSAENLPLLEYSYYAGDQTLLNGIENATDDVVTPYIEKKFNIKVKEYSAMNESMSPKEYIGVHVAANDLPDVMTLGLADAQYAISTGEFADLTDDISAMTNTNKYFDQNMWPRFTTDGKKYQIPTVVPNPNSPQYKDDPLLNLNPWCMWVREDILAKLGYKFTPLDQITKEKMDQGIKPTLDDMKIEPAIDTPDKFLDLLRKIKALNIMAGDKPLIPYSGSGWDTAFHMGSMFDYGHWRIDDKGQVSGFLGTPGAKDWFKFLNTMFNEGLIDKDFVLQKDDTLQEKIASGRVAAGLYIPDLNAAVSSLAQINPAYKIRYIPYPKQTPGYGFYDVYNGALFTTLIKKDFKDTKRLTQYFDWLMSDEGLDILTWGPESAGLWEMKDGKKVFKDPGMADALMNGTTGKKGPDNYGLWIPSLGFCSKAGKCAPMFNLYNPLDSRHSYPVKLNEYITAQNVCGMNSYDLSGKAAYSQGDVASNVDTYFWSKFVGDRIGRLLAAKTDADFEKTWTEQYNLFVKEGKYNEAQASMQKWFEANK